MNLKILISIVLVIVFANSIFAGDVGSLYKSLSWDGFVEESYPDSTVYHYKTDPPTSYTIYHKGSTPDNPKSMKWKINRKNNIVIKGFADNDRIKYSVDGRDKDVGFNYSISSNYVNVDSQLLKDNSIRYNGELSNSELYRYNSKTKKFVYVDEATGHSYNPEISNYLYHKFKFGGSNNSNFYDSFSKKYGMDKYYRSWNK